MITSAKKCGSRTSIEENRNEAKSPGVPVVGSSVVGSSVVGVSVVSVAGSVVVVGGFVVGPSVVLGDVLVGSVAPVGSVAVIDADPVPPPPSSPQAVRSRPTGKAASSAGKDFEVIAALYRGLSRQR
jgi:hypothetical protein